MNSVTRSGGSAKAPGPRGRCQPADAIPAPQPRFRVRRAGVDVAVVAFGGDRALVDELREAGVFVFVMVGTEDQARRAVSWGADGLIAQGGEAGGHLCGTTEALEFLPRALAVADGRPVLLAGGIATGDPTPARRLAAGASGVIAGTTISADP